MSTHIKMALPITDPNSKPFSCPLNCVKKYFSKTITDMKRHLIGTHGLKEKDADELLPQNLSIKCHLCTTTVSSKRRLIDHLNSMHFGNIQIEEMVLDSKQGKSIHGL